MVNLLCLNKLISEKSTDTVATVSIIALAVLLVITLLICTISKKANTREIVFCAICLALSFALSFIKFTPVTYGGSVTLASMVPICIYAYIYGIRRGLICGLIYGVLQFIQAPYMLTPLTFILDYLLAFSAICFMGLFKLFLKGQKKSVLLGITLVYFVRFIIHFISGLIYFKFGAIWTNLPDSSGAIYSFLYNGAYLLPDFIISFGITCYLVFTNFFNQLVGIAKK